MSDSLQPHRLQHIRPPYPSPSPEVSPSSCPLHQLCHPAVSSSDALFSFCSQSFQHQNFSNESALHIRWPKYWSFSFNISSSSEYSGLISFRMDWFDLLTVQATLKSLLQYQFKSIDSSASVFPMSIQGWFPLIDWFDLLAVQALHIQSGLKQWRTSLVAQTVTAATKLKDAYSLKEKLWQT